MAALMADCDFAIGAAGSTTWERCCLGLPSALIAIAENQEFALSILANAGIVHKFELNKSFATYTSKAAAEIMKNTETKSKTTESIPTLMNDLLQNFSLTTSI